MSVPGTGAFRTASNALTEAKYVLLRGLPTTVTSQDVRRLVTQKQIKGVSDVSLYYKHCRPTGKAVLTMALPDYTRDAIRESRKIVFPGCQIEAESVVDIGGFGFDSETQESPQMIGTGLAANCPERRTVTVYGLPGKLPSTQLLKLLKDFRVARDTPYPVTSVPLPPKKFSLMSRFLVYFESESEAQRFVRKYHMTRYKNLPTGPVLKAAIIY